MSSLSIALSINVNNQPAGRALSIDLDYKLRAQHSEGRNISETSFQNVTSELKMYSSYLLPLFIFQIHLFCDVKIFEIGISKKLFKSHFFEGGFETFSQASHPPKILLFRR